MNRPISIMLGALVTLTCAVHAREVNVFKELMIVHGDFVGSHLAKPGGPWTFEKLVKDLAVTAGSNPKLITKQWLATWRSEQDVLGVKVAARPGIDPEVIVPWMKRDGHTTLDFDTWDPNLANAPFRLLAIVNRMDLRHIVGGRIHDAGEGRFVFGVFKSDTVDLDADGFPKGAPLPFTVIFEYSLQAATESEVTQWANYWHDLGDPGLSTPDYLKKVNAVTDRFAAGNVVLNQLRTNEIALGDPWELREFNFTMNELKLVTSKQTPQNKLNNKGLLIDYVQVNEKRLLNHAHYAPEYFRGNRFLAGSVHANPGDKWKATGENADAVRVLSFNTCNGCHTGDTNTKFLHIGIKQSPKEQAELSAFLLGGNATANTEPNKPEDFDASASAEGFRDLWERKRLLESMLTDGVTFTAASPQTLTERATAEVNKSDAEIINFLAERVSRVH
ncbi:MAG: hypothetical protein SGI88_10120 [Candidatus Hydrogenedentes bacterium]|nr:hypothetical protein [Candidatus Hydrogenedentota bacterium]